MENLTPLALGWRRGAVGLAAGVVGRSGMGCGQQGGGVIRAAAGSGWKEQAGQVIGRAVRCSSGRPSPPRPGRSGKPSPWAARSFPVLIGAAAVLIGAGRGQKESQGGRRRPFTLAFSFLLLIEAGRVLPGADRGRGRLALVPAAPDPPARGTGHRSRWHRSAGAILPFAGGVRFFT